MSHKFTSIEFFGISGSGKTFCSSIVKKILIKKGYRVFNARECIINGSNKLIKLSLNERISLNYYRLLNFKNIKFKNNLKIYTKKKNNFSKIKNSSNFLKEIYFNICKRIIFKEKRKYSKILEEIRNILDNLKFLENKQYLFWIYELLAAHIIFKNYFEKKNKNLLILDEGLIQRSFTINKKILKKNYEKFFNYYFSKVPISNSIFLVVSSERKIHISNKERKLKNISKYKRSNELIKMKYFLNSYLIKQNKFKFSVIKNNKNLKTNLSKIF